MKLLTKLPIPYTIHNIKLSPRKHIKCVKHEGGYYYEIVALVPTNSLPGWYRSTIIKIYKDLAIVITIVNLSKESIDNIYAFSCISDTDRSLVGATIKVNAGYEIDYNPKNK